MPQAVPQIPVTHVAAIIGAKEADAHHLPPCPDNHDSKVIAENHRTDYTTAQAFEKIHLLLQNRSIFQKS
jgi:hypothetical protein